MRGEAGGAGEIVLNSIDTDGVKRGFDLEMLEALSKRVSLPIIASVSYTHLGMLPPREVPEHTEGREGFFHMYALSGDTAAARLEYIVRDHEDVYKRQGYGYVAKNGDVYFLAKKVKEYGKLSHLVLEDLEKMCIRDRSKRL